MRKIASIIVHCSASDNPDQDSLEAIKELHVGDKTKSIWWGRHHTSCKEWSDIGYHFVITKTGIEFGRPIEKVGAHCRGQNTYSVGICVTGEYIFTEKQKKNLKILLRHLISVFDLKSTDIYPHKHFNKQKTCPNFSLKEILDNL